MGRTIEAGSATTAPPVGRDLGPLGINLAEFVRRYNDATRDKDGAIVPAVVTVYEDRSIDLVTKTPTTAYLLRRAAGVEKGAEAPGREAAGSVTEEQLRRVAQTKMPDLNASSVETAMRVVAGTQHGYPGEQMIDSATSLLTEANTERLELARV
jgi:large subunit ribosomal protein L11